MRFPWLTKLAALATIVVVLLVALASVEGVVHERQRRQAEAEQGVASSLAGAQTLLGPVLLRHCHETWVRFEGEGRERSRHNERRDFTLTQWPRQLSVDNRVTLEPRYRGLFRINGYIAQSTLLADWAESELPVANRDLAKAQLSCEPAVVAVALSDARGLRSAVLTVDGSTRPVLPGSLLAGEPRGLHAPLPAGAPAGAAVHAEIRLALAGTRSLAWVPVADETTVTTRSDWPHPSFGGQFLPLTREVGPEGFSARWQISALATTAQQALREGARSCGLHEGGDAAAKPACVDAFGVSFIDPVNGYVLILLC